MIDNGRISAKNYAAQAEAGIMKWAAAPANYKYRDYDVFFCEMFARAIKNAVHFAIPDNGDIFDDDLRGLVGLQARLPYPVITVEYFVDDSKSVRHEAAPIYAPRRLVLAIETDKKEIVEYQRKLRISDNVDLFGSFPDDRFAQIMVANEINNDWVPLPMSWVLPATWDCWSGDSKVRTVHPLVPAKSKQHISGAAIPILPGIFNMLCESRGVDQTFREAIHDIGGEVHAILELCEALACSNVFTETVQHENTKANAKRVRNGKLPIYETKTLSIEVPKSTQRDGIKLGNRASPRQHLRRGHIRRLPDDRRIWVNSCAVGSPELGKIEKRYRVFSA